MRRRYAYVGHQDLRKLLERPNRCVCVRQPQDVVQWMKATTEPPNDDGTKTATFIIDTDGQLWINERRAEHVLCAAGEAVLSAGEMTFAFRKNQIEIVEVTNQSTGYCPEPESWCAVASALERIGLAFPPDFTTAYLFRRCDKCGTTNIVKDSWFECAVCLSPLSQHWNFDQP